MRKLIAGLAGAAMVASIAAPAFASTSTDVKGTTSESAVAQLEGLGIVTGDAGSGNFRPNDTITRGEFAVIADRLAGLGAAAQYVGQVDTSFKDVKKSYWGSGWVNVAKNAGLVAGYGDNTFRPDAPVSYAEVATVYLHLLGYSEAHLAGQWPTNDIIKAAALGLTSGVSFDANKAATRGDVAKMAQTLLGSDVVSWNTTSLSYDDGLKTLQKKIGFNDVKTFVVSSVDTTNSKVYLDAEDTTAGTVSSPVGYTYSSTTPLAGVSNVAATVGHQVTAVVDNNNNLLFLADSSSLNKSFVTLTAKNNGGTFQLLDSSNNDVTGKLAGNAVYALNGSASTQAAILTQLGAVGNTLSVSAVEASNGNILALVANKYDEAAAVVTVKSVGTSSSVLYYTDAATGTGSVTVGSSTVVTRDGKPATIADIQKNDVVMINGKNGTTATQVDAYSSTVSGKVTGVYSDSNGTKVTINGTSYTLNSTGVYNLDTAADVSVTTLQGTVVGNSYTFTVGPNNTVYALTQSASQTNEVAGFVTAVKSLNKLGSDGTLMPFHSYTIFTKAGQSQTLNINDTKADGTPEGTTFTAGHYVDVTLDSNGDVSSSTTDTSFTADTVVSVDTTKNTVTFTGTGSNVTLPVTSKTLIIDATNYTTTTPKLTTFDKIGAASSVKYSVDTTTGTLGTIVVTTNSGAVSALSDVSGMYAGKYQTVDSNNTPHYFAQLALGGTTTAYEVTSTVFNSQLPASAQNQLVRLTSASGTTYTGVVATGATSGYVTGTVTAANVNLTNSNFTLDGATDVYAIDSATKVYVVDSSNSYAVSAGNIYDVKNLATKPVAISYTTNSTYGGVTYKHADVVVITK